jgi:hypothetical protein
MSQRDRWWNQFERCTRWPQYVKPKSGLEKAAIEEQEVRLMHEEIDSFSVE